MPEDISTKPACQDRDRSDKTSSELEKAQAEVARLQKIIRSAIPRPFLRRLIAHESSPEDVQYLEEGQLSILFGDIRSYTHYAELMSSQELLGFLNTIFGMLGPQISKNHGFIDKFMGDAVMAVFDEEPSAVYAVQTAIEIQKELQDFNRRKGRAELGEIEFGIGVNTGPVVMGLLGSQSHFSSTVVGDPVNLAARLEELTKKFRSRILISHHTHALLPENVYLIREISSVRVRGKSRPTTVYEVFDCDPPSVKEKKLQTRTLLAQGIALYRDRSFSDSLEAFQSCLEVFPEDEVALEYVKRCHYFKNYPPPQEDSCWDEMIKGSGSIFEQSHLRQSARHYVKATAELKPDRSNGGVPGMVQDVSLGGMRVELQSSLKEGSLVKVDIDLQDTALAHFFTKSRLKVLCQVLWNKRAATTKHPDAWEVGLKFIATDPDSEQLLRDLPGCPVRDGNASCPLNPVFQALRPEGRSEVALCSQGSGADRATRNPT